MEIFTTLDMQTAMLALYTLAGLIVSLLALLNAIVKTLTE